ncbi:hypothetical protein [Aliivibrio fischeri]|uniref:hypothetical protein n=1 Tax=Aliivibrio fischeri TaxID=668 RepID=UPI001F25B286|nr:hypothetical protein [Aliivibrio fischeri]MCE7556431.1 hypothetical protein [Aliivibrio fischeri]MCE7563004.1 hypothetical protein [Aliivibrio fischeri]MCE7571296.1 hypothetical protein [Aliivibrio fischeri]
MEIILEIVLPVLGFILAIVGAWDKLLIALSYLSTKNSSFQLKLAQFELKEIEKFNSSTNYLVAYQFKQLFLIIAVLLFITLLNSSFFQDYITNIEVILYIQLALCWLAGFFSGQAIQATNYVLNRKFLTEKNEKIRKKYEVKIKQRT